MADLQTDTSPKASALQREILAEQSSVERAEVVDSLCLGVTELAKAGIRWSHPDASESDVMMFLLVRRYGQEFVDSLPEEAIDKIRAAQES